MSTGRESVAVVGAGPYGLAVAAELRGHGVQVRVFGRVMSFWREHMPAGMFLRSSWAASHIGHPRGPLTLSAFESHRAIALRRPIPLADFVAYGEWFQRQAVNDVDERQVVAISPAAGAFQLLLSDGERVAADRVVVAAGIASFATRPKQVWCLPRELVSHSSDHADFTQLKGRTVLVVGAGQSAIESGALLSEAGADVEVVVRAARVRWLHRSQRLHAYSGVFRSLLYPRTDVGPVGLSLILAQPALWARLPVALRERIARRAIRPAVASWLSERMRWVRLTTAAEILAVERVGPRLRVSLKGGGVRLVDHIICATGYRLDIARYGFLSPELLAMIARRDGAPLLGSGFESSVPGLHFVGAPGAWTFGPIMRFVSGSSFAAASVAGAVLHTTTAPVRWPRGVAALVEK